MVVGVGEGGMVVGQEGSLMGRLAVAPSLLASQEV